jgi:hypothetical protein
MNLIAWFVIVPLSLAALMTGLVQTPGYEVRRVPALLDPAKFLLTVSAIVILLLHMPTVSRMWELASEMTASVDPGAVRIQLLVHAMGGLLVLIVTTTLMVDKPWGKTQYGAA